MQKRFKVTLVFVIDEFSLTKKKTVFLGKDALEHAVKVEEHFVMFI